jgi:hypothetical protein
MHPATLIDLATLAEKVRRHNDLYSDDIMSSRFMLEETIETLEKVLERAVNTTTTTTDDRS